MLQAGRGADFAQEPLAAECRAEVGVQYFDRDVAIVFQVVRQVDGGHATRAECAFDAIAMAESLGQTGGWCQSCASALRGMRPAAALKRGVSFTAATRPPLKDDIDPRPSSTKTTVIRSLYAIPREDRWQRRQRLGI